MEHEAESATAGSTSPSDSACEQAEGKGKSVRLARPWFHRLYLAVPLPSAVAASLLYLLAGSLVLMPRWLGWTERYWAGSAAEASLMVTLIFAYSTWASYLTHQHNASDHLRHLDELATDPDVYWAEIFRTTHFRPGVLRAGLLGPAVPLVAGLVTGRTQALFYEPDLSLVWSFALFAACWYVLAEVFAISAASYARFWSLGRNHTQVNLLDLDRLGPWPRCGLRTALAVLGSGLIYFPMALGFDVVLWVSFLMYCPFLLLGLVGFLVPNAGIRLRIRETKRDELRRVRAAIAGESGALDASPLASRQDELSLADLLAYQERVESLRDWPMDASTFRRFGLYLLIPLGSWLGSALVERLLDRFWS